jgi:hypothetical protein
LVVEVVVVETLEAVAVAAVSVSELVLRLQHQTT